MTGLTGDIDASAEARRVDGRRSFRLRSRAPWLVCVVALAVVALAVVALWSPAGYAVTVVPNYTFDTTGFFGAGHPNGAAVGAQAKAALEAAATFFSRMLTDTLAAIQVPPPFQSSTGATVTWTWRLSFINPGTGALAELNNQTIAANEYRIYVGGRSLAGGTLGVGGTGGVSNLQVVGPPSLPPGEAAIVNQTTNAFFYAVSDRGEPSGFDRWGGSLTFDNDGSTTWHYDHLTPPTPGTNDFYSVALHEMAHALGFGTSDEWSSFAGGSLFTGPAATAAYGSMPPLAAPAAPDFTRSHWQSSTMSPIYGKTGVQEAAMDPELTQGTRKLFTTLDASALADIGWQVAGAPHPADFNFDGAVNAADFTAWKSAFGATGAADADGDSDSDGLDFLAWQRARGLPSAAVLSAIVPEPGAVALGAISFARLAGSRRSMLSRRSALRGL